MASNSETGGRSRLLGRRGGGMQHDEAAGLPELRALFPARLDRACSPTSAREEVGRDNMPDLAAIRVVGIETEVGDRFALVEVGEIDTDTGDVAKGEIGQDRAVDGRGVLTIRRLGAARWGGRSPHRTRARARLRDPPMVVRRRIEAASEDGDSTHADSRRG